MNSKNYIDFSHLQVCCSDIGKCPCRLIDLNDDIIYCNFVKSFANILILDNEKATKLFLDKVCSDLRDEVLHHDYRATQLQKRAKKFLRQVKIGDLIYSIRQDQNVIFLEFPTHKYGDCKYRTIDGKVKEDAPFLFNVVSKGDKFNVYKTKDKNKAYLYELEARECGFRVEGQEKGDYYVLKIFGDTQEEVDSFITILNNDFILDDY